MLRHAACFLILWFVSLGDSPADEAPVLLLEGVELGEGVARHETVRVACVDAPDEGIDSVVEEALPQSAHDQLCDRLVLLLTTSTEGLEEDTQLITH